MINDYRFIYEYLLNKSDRLENEINLFYNNLAFRQFDELDHLENIILITRKKAFDEFSRDLYNILKIVM